MHKPRARLDAEGKVKSNRSRKILRSTHIVSCEADSHRVAGHPGGHHVANGRIIVVVGGTSSTTDNMECML
jgi:hypothetical protein